jgi:hypothetical protein
MTRPLLTPTFATPTPRPQQPARFHPPTRYHQAHRYPRACAHPPRRPTAMSSPFDLDDPPRNPAAAPALFLRNATLPMLTQFLDVDNEPAEAANSPELHRAPDREILEHLQFVYHLHHSVLSASECTSSHLPAPQIHSHLRQSSTTTSTTRPPSSSQTGPSSLPKASNPSRSESARLSPTMSQSSPCVF